MSTPRFPVRRYRAYPLPGQEYDDHNFGYVEQIVAWAPENTAVVSVDLWDMGWSPEPLDPALGREAELNFMGVGWSLLRVMQEIETDHIAPALDAARAAGLTVIHCNMPHIVRKHPENALVSDEPSPSVASIAPDWPPAEVSAGWLQDYVDYTWGQGAEPRWERMRELADFPPPLQPRAGDIVLYQQSVMDRVLKERGIFNLVYVGFMLNMCLMDKDGGVRHMVPPYRSPGYRGIVLRDCTCATESHETVDEMGVTRAWLYHLETTGVPTALSEDFIAACRALG